MESTATTTRLIVDHSAKVRNSSETQLLKLRELVNLQQEQIDNKSRLLLDKEQRRSYLANLQLNSTKNGHVVVDYDQNMIQFRERISSQESRLHRLRAIKSQLKVQRSANTNLCSELETMRSVFKEKEHELSVANEKIDALTRQLDDIAIRTKASNNNKHISGVLLSNGTKHISELERLRQELLYKSKICQQNEQHLMHKRNLLYKCQSDEILLNTRVKTLQDRLARKIEFNRHAKTSPISSLSSNNHEHGHEHVKTLAALACDDESVQRTQKAFSASLSRAVAAATPSNYNPKRCIASKTTIASTPTSTTVKIASPNSSAKTKPASSILPPAQQTNQAQNIAAVEPFQRSEPLTTTQQIKNQINYITNKHFSTNCDDSSSSSKDKDSGISLDIHGGKASPEVEDDDDTTVPKDMLEDRPSPSGSSGSSDRISTSYPFSDQKHRAYSTSSTNNSSGTDSGIDQIDRTSCNYSSRHHFPAAYGYLERQPITNDDFMSRIPDGSIISRNETSVSDLIQSFNTKCRTIINGSDQSATDWQRTKRRPVTDEADLEKELANNSQTLNFRTGSAASVDTISIEATTTSPEVVKMVHDVEQASESCELESFESSIDSNLSSLVDVDETLVRDSVEPTDMSIINNSDLLPTRQDIDRSLRSILRTGARKSLRVRFDPLVLLLDAALEGELELVENLAKQVPNLSASNDEGITALHNATCAGHFEIVKFLIEYGFDVNAQDTDGWMPLHCAASCNNLPMIKFLVNSGAAIFGTTFTDDETAAQKCEEDEEGFDGCSQYLYAVQEQLGIENGGIVYALYDYTAEREDELCFVTGDAIQIVRKTETNWWWARSSDQSEGFVPKTFIGLYPRLKTLH